MQPLAVNPGCGRTGSRFQYFVLGQKVPPSNRRSPRFAVFGTESLSPWHRRADLGAAAPAGLRLAMK